MRVHVVFEHPDGVWLPLFKPIPDIGPVATTPDPDIRSTIRPMLRTERFERSSVPLASERR